MLRYPIVIKKTKKKYGAYSPELACRVTTGMTIRQTVLPMRSAVKFHLKGLKKEGAKMSKSSIKVDYVDIALRDQSP